MRRAATAALLGAALAVGACATAYDDGDGRYGRFGDYGYGGRDYDRLGNECGFWDGSGGDLLDPWLACTEEGREIVRRGFDEDGDRQLSAETADRANIWFRRHADTDRDMELTDPEIRAALVNGARHFGL